MKQNYFIFLALIALSFQSCNEARNLFSASVMGEIVNPQADYITILQNNKVVDSVPLDGNNQFFYFFDKSKPGFYTFRHNYNSHYETQMFYVEPGDSLQFRLNTKDFDNSLMYSGAGAAKNNFLMALYNENKHNSRALSKYTLNPKVFSAKVDSIRIDQRKRLKALYEDHKISENFNHIGKTLIDFGKYDLHERYLFLISRFRPALKEELPSDFLSYRDTIDFNHKTLQTYYTYQYFLDDYLRNKSVSNCLAKSEQDNCFDLRSKENLRNRLRLSDSLFKRKSLRSLFLTRYAARLVVQSKTEDEVDGVVYFLKNASDYGATELKEVETLAAVQKHQFIGDISQIELAPFRGDNKTISKIISNRSTILYYWSLHYVGHHQQLHQKISELQKRFPYVNFIGINIDNQEIEEWEKTVKKYNYNTDYEYQLICPPEEQSFYRNYLNKLVFVSPKGEIIPTNLSAGDFDLEEKIAQLIR